MFFGIFIQIGYMVPVMNFLMLGHQGVVI